MWSIKLTARVVCVGVVDTNLLQLYRIVNRTVRVRSKEGEKSNTDHGDSTSCVHFLGGDATLMSNGGEQLRPGIRPQLLCVL